MAHTYSQNHVHIVFSTKERRKTIPKELLPELWAYLAGVGKNHNMAALAAGGTENHVHVPVASAADVAAGQRRFASQSEFIEVAGRASEAFRVAGGLGAFSVSASSVDAVVRYIQNQPAYHRKVSFEDEFRALPRKHGVDYDPKFVFG